MIGFWRRCLVGSKGTKRLIILYNQQEVEITPSSSNPPKVLLQILLQQQFFQYHSNINNVQNLRGMVRLAYPNRDDILDEVREELRFLQVPQRSFTEALNEILEQQVPLEELDYLIYVEQEQQQQQQEQQNLIYDLQRVEFQSLGWVNEAINYLMNDQKVFDDVQFCYQVLVRSKIESVFSSQQEEFGDLYITQTNRPFHVYTNSKFMQNQQFQFEKNLNYMQQQQQQQKQIQPLQFQQGLQSQYQNQDLNIQFQQQQLQQRRENSEEDDFLDHDLSNQINHKNLQQHQNQIQNQNQNQKIQKQFQQQQVVPRQQKLFFWEVKLLENLKGVITMMFDFGAQHAHIQKALLQFPEIISHDVHELYTSLQFLLSNGMPRKHGWIVLCENPQVLYLPLYQLKKKLYMLKEIGVDLNQFLKRTMVFRGAFREMDKWEESVKFLHNLGLLKEPNILAKGPRLLFLHKENAVHVLQYLVDIGIPNEKVYQVIRDYPEVLACSVKYKLKREVSTMCRILSASKEEVARMIVRLPQLLSYNISGDSMQKKIEFLKQEFGRHFKQQLMEYPQILSYNLFERLGPRIAFVKHMKRRDVKLKRMLQYSDENFSLNVCNSSIQHYVMFKQEWQQSAGLEWKQLDKQS